MTPIVGFAQLPEVQAGCKERAIHPGRELLATRVQRVHTGRFRGRLNDPGVRVRFHQAHQVGQAIAGHHRVGVQYDHIAILAAPAAAEVIDVAAFTFHAAAAAAIENLPFALHLGNQLHPGFLLCDADIRVVAVAENVDIKMLMLPGRDPHLRCRSA